MMLLLNKYPIVETFHSLQGEGAWAGCSAFFIRLAGCNVGCPFCDTKESWRPDGHPDRSVETLLMAVQNAQPAIVVITGGEPLMHNLTNLTTVLGGHPWRLHLETSGAYPLSGTFDWITLSPKPYLPPDRGIYAQVQELKIVIQQERDLLWAETQAQKVSEDTLLYLQPEWYTTSSQRLVIDYICSHRQWRLSLQTHKYLDIK